MMSNLKHIFITFFKLGLVAFGGPAAHIALMEREIVEKKKWMNKDKFIDYIGLTSLIPGPNSTEMVMCCGLEKGKRPGVIASGLAFLIPAVVITFILAWFYVEYGALPEFKSIYNGIKPAVIALIAVALYKLWNKAVKGPKEMVIAGIAIVLCFIQIDSIGSIPEILILLISGVLGISWFFVNNRLNSISILPVLMAVSSSGWWNNPNIKVFLTFLKIGSILYGSGMVLFAYLDGELVATGLLTRVELMDSVAAGQFTPGPVLSTATFIGYLLEGPWGAILATLGIFLPSFLFVMFLHPFLHSLKKISWFGAFLSAVNAAAVALMVYVLFKMGKDTLSNDWLPGVMTLIYLFIFLKLKKIDPAFVIIASGLFGWAISM